MSDKTTQVVPVVPLEDGRDDITVLRNRIEELERLLPADGVHSCGPHCTRLGCVQRRKIEQMEADALWRDTRIEELEGVLDRVRELPEKWRDRASLITKQLPGSFDLERKATLKYCANKLDAALKETDDE